MPTTEEQIHAVKKELKQAQNRLKILENRERDIERRERTHRLIERGAILESLVPGLDKVRNEQVQQLLIVALRSRAAVEHLRSLGLGLSRSNPLV